MYNSQAPTTTNPNGKEFIIADGPPFANGALHIGHAFNKILKDTIARFKLLQGYKVRYENESCSFFRLQPAWDCHGLPIEVKAIKAGNDALDPVELRDKCKQFAETSIKNQLAEMMSWGLLIDTTNIIKTTDPKYEAKQLRIFAQLVRKGLVYSALRPVHWSLSSKTALAEAELEYKDIKGVQAWYKVRLVGEGNVHALVWTTTPWTVPVNEAIAFNPNLDYVIAEYAQGTFIIAQKSLESTFSAPPKSIRPIKLSGMEYEWQGRKPFLPAEWVTEVGTGLVHVAPCYGENDFALAQEFNLPVPDIFNDDGSYGCFKDIEEATEYYLRLAWKHEPYIHTNHAIDWRTHHHVITRCTKQWFLNISRDRPELERAIHQASFIPARGKERLKEMIQTRDAWCISRQRAWGVPIPAIEGEGGSRILDSNVIEEFADYVENDSSNAWWQMDSFTGRKIVKPVETMDVWFDSGTMWANLPSMADIYVEGIDQFRGWFQSSLILSVLSKVDTMKAPFRTLLAHGFVLDKDGNKMSKSLGNVIEPSNVILQYGLDTLRYWACSNDWTKSIMVSNEHLKQAQVGLQVIRGALRYMQGNLGDFKEPIEVNEMRTIDKIAIARTNELIREYSHHMQMYNFQLALATIQSYLQHLSAFYFDSVKDRLYCGFRDERRQIQTVLHYIKGCITALVYPILPLLVEEILSVENGSSGLNWPKVLPADPELLRLGEKLEKFKSVSSMIRQRGSKGFYIPEGEAKLEISEREANEILQAAETTFTTSHQCDTLVYEWTQMQFDHGMVLDVGCKEMPLKECPRCRLANRAHDKELCDRCERVMSAAKLE